MSNVDRLNDLLGALDVFEGLGTVKRTREAAEALDAAGVFVPPPGATIASEGRVVRWTPDGSSPFEGAMLSWTSEGRVISEDGIDVTERYHAWLATLPAVETRSYEWPEDPPVCPECAAGKHAVCVGEALHPILDVIVPCRCDDGHAGEPS